jgi:hypothetical protein
MAAAHDSVWRVKPLAGRPEARRRRRRRWSKTSGKNYKKKRRSYQQGHGRLVPRRAPGFLRRSSSPGAGRALLYFFLPEKIIIHLSQLVESGTCTLYWKWVILFPPPYTSHLVHCFSLSLATSQLRGHDLGVRDCYLVCEHTYTCHCGMYKYIWALVSYDELKATWPGPRSTHSKSIYVVITHHLTYNGRNTILIFTTIPCVFYLQCSGKRRKRYMAQRVASETVTYVAVVVLWRAQRWLLATCMLPEHGDRGIVYVAPRQQQLLNVTACRVSFCTCGGTCWSQGGREGAHNKQLDETRARAR